VQGTRYFRKIPASLSSTASLLAAEKSSYLKT
jgi:hypothetical protein